MKTTRVLLAAAAAVAGLVISAGPAQADPPPTVSQSIPLPGTDTADEDGYCPFAVVVDYVTRQKTRVTTNADGSESQRFTGPATATVRRDDGTTKSVTYKVNGPGTLTTYPDGSFTIDAGGQNLFWTTFENSFTGVPQLAYTKGHVQLSVDATGETTAYSLSGTRVDVCAALS